MLVSVGSPTLKMAVEEGFMVSCSGDPKRTVSCMPKQHARISVYQFFLRNIYYWVKVGNFIYGGTTIYVRG